MAEQATGEKILDKFEGEPALDTAITEIHKKVMGDDVPLPTFSNLDAKIKAYKRYETVMRNPPANGDAKPPAPPKPEHVAKPDEILTLGAPPDDDPDVDTVITKAGLNAAEVTKQYADHKKFTDEQYAAFKKAGFGRKMIDTLAAGQYATATLRVQENQAIRAEGVAVAGGEEAFKNLNSWFEANHPERVKTLNEMVKASPKAYPEVIRMMVTEHAAALGAGKAQPLVTGGVTTNSPDITTWAELRALNKKSAEGDAAATERLKRITPEMKKKLK